MAVKKILIKQEDKYCTTLNALYCNDKPKGSVVLLHGMAEHHERYYEFAAFLNSCGFDVFLYDHRGHGTDKKIDDLGYFSESDGDKKVICDAIEVLAYVTKVNRGKKLILFAHSMGSLIARNLIQYYDAVDCVILCGTTNPPRAKIRAGLMLASIIRLLKGPKHRSRFMDKMMFGGRNFTKISERTAYDWLSRNHTLVGNYVHDAFCGFLCTVSFYRDLLRLALGATSLQQIKRTRKDLPIYLICGSQDPVGNYSKEVSSLFSLLQRLNFTKVDCTIYEACRHELLNEMNSIEIMKDIVAWIDGIAPNRKNTDSHKDTPKLNLTPEEKMDVHQLVCEAFAELEAPETAGEKKLAEIRAKKRAKKEAENKEKAPGMPGSPGSTTDAAKKDH